MKQTKRAEGNLSRIGGIIVILAIGITTAVSWLLYEHTVNLLTDNLRQRLLSIAITHAANIDYRDVEALQVEEDWEKPEWSRVVKNLKKTKSSNPNIVFMYIFRKKKDNAQEMEFVADAESINPYANTDNDSNNDIDANGDGVIEPEGPDQLQWPGQDYPSPPEEAFLAYTGPLTNKDLYEDAYGQVLTGYAPIKDDAGNTIAVLGTDIKVDDFLIVTRQTLYPFLLFILFLVIAIVILSAALIKLWNKRIEIFAEIDRQKDELLSIVSHQLATPVTSIRWQLEMMLDGDIGKLTKEQKEHVESTRKVTANLVDLIGMILDVSRIQLGKMKVSKQELNLNEYFKELVSVIEPRAMEKKVKLIKNIPAKLPVAMLDKRLTNMTLENLLSNAVKYTPSGGEVEFTVTLKGNMLSCVIRDTGCGIPEKDQSQIFGKLFRASNVRNAVDGNGFGLYVAKGAVESQGGHISFESKEGKGTTFYVELPIR